MSGKNSHPVQIREYQLKDHGELYPWLKIKYSPGCQTKAIDLPKARAYELYTLLREYFGENALE